VIGRARSLPKKSEEQATEEFSQEHGRAPDAQELHDAMTSTPNSPRAIVGEQEDSPALGANRLAKMQHQNSEFARLRKEANKPG
jgi:hypothetical protein